MILILNILDFENGKHRKFQFNWSISFRDINIIININMQILEYSMRIRFWSKTFNIFLYTLQDVYNNFKYGFHDKYINLTTITFLSFAFKKSHYGTLLKIVFKLVAALA